MKIEKTLKILNIDEKLNNGKKERNIKKEVKKRIKTKGEEKK
jgi:hypothetical protein